MPVTSSVRGLGWVLVCSLLLPSCVTLPGSIPAIDHFNQTYRTRALPGTADVFIRPGIKVYKKLSYESVLVELRKEVNATNVLLNVTATLIDTSGRPFQSAEAGDDVLDFTHVDLDTYRIPDHNLNAIELTVDYFRVGVPLELASSAACESSDFVIQLSGTDRNDFDLTVPRALLQGFLGKLKKSGERGVEGECIDEIF